MSRKDLYIYYFVLLVILCSWTDPNHNPPAFFRFAFLAAMAVPVVLKHYILLPPVLVCFTGISAYGAAESYLPSENYYFTLAALVTLILHHKYIKHHVKIPAVLAILAVYMIFIDQTTGGELTRNNYSICTIIFSLFLINRFNVDEQLYSISFIIITIVLCLIYFTLGDQFIRETTGGVERVGWKDANYMGCVAGMGIMCAYNMLITKSYNNTTIRNIAIGTIVVGIVMLLLNASRGAALAVAVGLLTFTLFTNISLTNKIAIILVVALGFYILWELGLFTALEQRIADDTGTGNGRTLIWAYKLEGFLNSPVYNLFTGLGFWGGFMLGTVDGYGFHNDFIAFFVDYGIIGFFLFVWLLIYPIWKVRNNRKLKGIVVPMILYLATCSMTLEPMTAGRLTYFFFYMYIIVLINKQTTANSKTAATNT